MQVTIEVLEVLTKVAAVSKEYQELLGLLQKPHFQVNFIITLLPVSLSASLAQAVAQIVFPSFLSVCRCDKAKI